MQKHAPKAMAASESSHGNPLKDPINSFTLIPGMCTHFSQTLFRKRYPTPLLPTSVAVAYDLRPANPFQPLYWAATQTKVTSVQ